MSANPEVLPAASGFPAPLRPEAEHLENSQIQEIWEMGFGQQDVIGLWVGEGDLPTPDFISEAAVASLRAGETHYTPKRGLDELRQALADYHARLHGIAPDMERITVTSSGMTAIVMILQAILRPGERVVVVSPVWPNIVSAVEIAGGEVVPLLLDLQPDGGFRLDLDKLADAVDENTRAVFIASPGNPTGWMMEAEEQRAVMDLLRGRNIWLLADEVYHRITFDRPDAPSFLSQAGPEDALLVINSFSKPWAMTGWRIGWIVHPPSVAEPFNRLIEFLTSGGQTFLQRGCLAAITQGDDFVAEMVERCRQSGEIVYAGLGDLPRVTIAKPKAAFYSFFKVEGVIDSLAYTKRILRDAKVGLAPGTAFGPGGEGYFRLCFASAPERVAQAVERLRPLLS